MRHLLNTLFVTTEDAYLTLDGENVVVRRESAELARFPLHTLENIVAFTYAGASPALMGACAKRGVNLSFCTPSGRFLARTCGASSGNVLLRRAQYRIADDERASCEIARNMIFGKVHNARWSVGGEDTNSTRPRLRFAALQCVVGLGGRQPACTLPPSGAQRLTGGGASQFSAQWRVEFKADDEALLSVGRGG